MGYTKRTPQKIEEFLIWMLKKLIEYNTYKNFFLKSNIKNLEN